MQWKSKNKKKNKKFKIENDKWLAQWQNDYLIYCSTSLHLHFLLLILFDWS